MNKDIKKGDNVVLYKNADEYLGWLRCEKKGKPFVHKIEVVGEDVVTCVRKTGHSSGGTDYNVYLKGGTVFHTTDWNWALQTNDFYGFVGTREELEKAITLGNKVRKIKFNIEKLNDKIDDIVKNYPDEVVDVQLKLIEDLLEKF